MTKKRAILDAAFLSGIHMNYWAGITIESTFLVTFMTLAGYSATEIGLVVAVSNLTTLIMQPLWGFLSDKYRNIKLIVILCLSCTAAIVLFLANAIESGVLYTVVLYTLLGCFKGPIAGLVDSLTYIGAEQNKYIQYSIARGTGSLFSAVAMLFGGRILDRIGVRYAFVLEAVLLILGIFAAVFYSGKRYGVVLTERETEEKTTIRDTIKRITANKALIFLAVSVILINIGINASYTLSPRMIVDMGGTAADNGYAMAINTVGMMPCMMLYSYLLGKKKVPNHILYLLACVFSIMRILSLALVNTLPVMFGIQIISSLQYGFLQPAMLTEISNLVEKRIRTTTITLVCSLQTGFSYVAGSLIAGRIADVYGVKTVFYLFSIVAVAGIVSFFKTIKLRKNNKEGSA